MSFVFKYQLTSDAPPVTLTALVGRDEQLYWFAKGLRPLLGNYAYCSDLRARDVLGWVPGLPGQYSRQFILAHTTLLERLRSAPCRIHSRKERCHRLADLLTDSTLAVRSLRERPAYFLVQPSEVEAVEEEAAGQSFTVWLEFFKQRVFRELYRQPLYSVAPFEDVPDVPDPLLDANALCASLSPTLENHGHPPTLTACVPTSSSHPSSPSSGTLCSSPPRLSRDGSIAFPSESTLPSTIYVFHQERLFTYSLAGP